MEINETISNLKVERRRLYEKVDIYFKSGNTLKAFLLIDVIGQMDNNISQLGIILRTKTILADVSANQNTMYN